MLYTGSVRSVAWEGPLVRDKGGRLSYQIMALLKGKANHEPYTTYRHEKMINCSTMYRKYQMYLT